MLYNRLNKKSFLQLCSFIVFHWCPRYAKKAYSVIRDREHGFLSHAHVYRGKIDELRLEKVLDRKFKYWKV